MALNIVLSLVVFVMNVLMSSNVQLFVLLQVLRNLQLYLSEEDEKMRKADAECNWCGYFYL